MGWKLAPGIGYCVIGGSLVFLDLARDRYVALQSADRAAFDRLRSGEANDSEAMTRLIATGFIARGEHETCLDPTRTEVPAHDLCDASDNRFSFAMSLAAARALRWAGRAMRPERIAAAIETLRQAKQALMFAAPPGEAERLAARYAACRWVNPVPPRCLIDALAIDRILLSRGVRATLVFGVRLDPFAAHCWLQSSDAVLTGTAAEARNFHPILVVT